VIRRTSAVFRPQASFFFDPPAPVIFDPSPVSGTINSLYAGVHGPPGGRSD
jgi:hypothetical protein